MGIAVGNRVSHFDDDATAPGHHAQAHRHAGLPVVDRVGDHRMDQRFETGGAPHHRRQTVHRQGELQGHTKAAERGHEVAHDGGRQEGRSGRVFFDARGRTGHRLGGAQHALGGADDDLAARAKLGVRSILGGGARSGCDEPERSPEFVVDQRHRVEASPFHLCSTSPLQSGHPYGTDAEGCSPILRRDGWGVNSGVVRPRARMDEMERRTA